MVYQNLNKTEKYHPTTTKRKKSFLLLVEIASADPEAGQGVRTPWKITSYMGSYTHGCGGIASRGRFVPVFLRGNKWQLMIFMGRSGPRVSNSLNSHFIIIFFAGPGQFTKRLLIISAVAKGKRQHDPF